jgi:hypothetical protein
MPKLTTPIPQDKIGESFVWRDWFQRLSDKVFGDLATQNASNVNITGGSITGINFGVTSLIPGNGINVSSPIGDVIVSNAGVTSVGGTGTVNGITLSGTVTTSGNITLGGTLSGVSLTSQVSGILPVANGGTGLGRGYTVATLPTAGTQGRRAWVTNALAPTFLAAPVGGGTVVCPVFDNGTSWVVG